MAAPVRAASLTPDQARANDDVDRGVLHSIWNSGLWRLFPFLALYSIGIAITIPITPSLITNGFASHEAGKPLDCQEFAPDKAPLACRDAHATVVQWSSVTNFVSSCLLSFFCAPIVGRLSDQYGRKPFILLGIVFFTVPVGTVMLHLWGWIEIFWYFPASVLNGAVSAFHMCLVTVSDLIDQKHRATAVGLLTSMFSIGILVGPAIGGAVASPLVAIYTCLGMLLLCFFYTILIVPEAAPAQSRADKAATATGTAAVNSAAHEPGAKPRRKLVPPAARPAPGALPTPFRHVATNPGGSLSTAAEVMPAEEAALIGGGAIAMEDGVMVEDTASLKPGPKGGSDASGALLEDKPLLSGLQIIAGSKFYRRLALLWIVFTINMEGAQVLLIQYLQLKLGFTTQDNASLFVVMAASGLVVKLGLLAWLVRTLGEQNLVMLGLGAYCLEDLALALAPSKAYVLGAVSVGSIAGVCWPALVALQSSRVSAEQQGAVYGAMQGITALASGLGPLAFAALFSAFTRSDSRLPYMPSIVWYVSSALMLVGLGLAATLHMGTGNAQEEEAKAAGGGTAAGRGSCAAGAASRGSSTNRSIGASAPLAHLSSMRSFQRAMSRLLRSGSSTLRRSGSGTGDTDVEQPLLANEEGGLVLENEGVRDGTKVRSKRRTVGSEQVEVAAACGNVTEQ